MKGGVVVWLTGRPSSGKSEIGRALVARLRDGGAMTCLLDGDEVRAALLPRPGYDTVARANFYATLSGLASLLARQGLVVVVAATAHARAYRQRARSEAPRFVEVFVRSDAAVCAARDAKGLYGEARAGRVANLPGADLAYEEPAQPDIVVTGEGDADVAAAEVAAALAAVRSTDKEQG